MRICLLGRDAVSLGEWFPTCRRNYCFYILGLISASAFFFNSLNPEYKSNSVVRNVEDKLPNYKGPYHKKLEFSAQCQMSKIDLRVNPEKFRVPGTNQLAPYGNNECNRLETLVKYNEKLFL
jgi:hypothetical protein